VNAVGVHGPWHLTFAHSLCDSNACTRTTCPPSHALQTRDDAEVIPFTPFPEVPLKQPWAEGVETGVSLVGGNGVTTPDTFNTGPIPTGTATPPHCAVTVVTPGATWRDLQGYTTDRSTQWRTH
jgi:hypothetical protein